MTLRIYSVHPPDFVRDDVEYAGPSITPEEVWEKVKAECDAVILPYVGPDLDHQVIYRTHFPSKLPEYLALGMPVIITGPYDATGMKWGMTHPRACISIETGPTERWQTELTRLRDDAEYRLALAQGAADASGQELDPERIENGFLSKLRELGKAGAFARPEFGMSAADAEMTKPVSFEKYRTMRSFKVRKSDG